nr:NAD+ synthase [Deltaproteobacteria bacterium]
MKIALGQINTTIGDFTGNIAKIRAAIVQAKRESCNLIVFPELTIPGYPPTDYVDKADFREKCMRALDDLARETAGIGVIVGYIEPAEHGSGGLPYNAAALLHEGAIKARAYKRLLPSYDVFDENRYFQPGTDNSVCFFQGMRLGITICEDIWNDKDFFAYCRYPSDPVANLATQQMDLLINLSGSPFFLGKRNLRVSMISSIARKHTVPVVYVNLVGGNDSLLFDGGSMAVDATGYIRAQAREFIEDLITFDMKTNEGNVHPFIEDEEALTYQALVIGTRDYIRKCGFTKAIIGLSGGIDSSLTACIAADALGNKQVWGVAMPSQYSAAASLEDAEKLARNLNINFQVIPITKLFQVYRQELAPVFSGLPEDLTEENLQARIRGTLLMALANKFNGLVLTTSNKSEVAVGYSTLYGDMAGGLAVIADIPKTMVYRLSRFLNQAQEVIPQRVITRPPSAELKPNQTDQDTLPPYDVLDALLIEYIENNRSVSDIIDRGYDRGVVMDTIRRIHTSEYKRKQAPPGLKVTSKAFGPGRRYPIAHKFIY